MIQYAGYCESQANILNNRSYTLDVPYIANYIYEHPALGFNLKGIWIADPLITHLFVQEQIPALRFVQVCVHSWNQ